METSSLPHVGQMIAQFLTRNHIAKSALARLLNVNYKTVVRYTQQPNLTVHTLYQLSQQSHYNFFREIANTLPESYAPKAAETSTATIAQLNQQIAALELEVKTLKEALKLVGGR